MKHVAGKKLGRLPYWIVIPIAIGILYLPFLNQAFHIDDRIYLETAENARNNPLYPYDYSPVFEGLVTPDAASHSHLPFMAYFLAAVLSITGSKVEWVLHLAFLVFPLIAGFAFHDLARRYVKFPLAATLLLLGAPAFMTLGHTLMPDVALLSMWLLALSRFLRIAEGDGELLDRILCAGAVLVSSFMSLQSAGLLLLMGAYLLLSPKDQRRSESRLFWLALFILPLLLWGGWYLRAFLHYDRFVLVNTFLHMDKRQTFDWALMGAKAVSFAVNIGGVFLCPIFLWYSLAGRFRTRIGLIVFFASLIPFYLWIEGWHSLHILLFATLFASGFLVLWEFALLAADAQPKTRLLFFWFVGILASCFLLFYAGSVRYVLLALPPVIIAVLSRLERRIQNQYLLRNLVWIGVVLTLVYALPISFADYRFAETYRRAAREIVSQYGGQGHFVWFTGEWGFRHYMEGEGGHLLIRTLDSAQPGDIIVKPFIASPWVTLYDGAPYSRFVEQRPVQESFPVRILDFSTHAGFYSTGWGVLPFSFSVGENWEWFNVFQVTSAYDGEIPEAEKHF